MITATVVGEVWATRRAPGLDALKLMVVRPDGWYRPFAPTGHLVCVDAADAGVGDRVLVSWGAPARALTGGRTTPVDAVILGIVDGWTDETGAHGHPSDDGHDDLPGTGGEKGARR